MYKAVIYNTATMNVKKHYKTMSAASGAYTRLSKTQDMSQLAVVSISLYNELNTEVTVYSMMNGAPIKIRKSEVGTGSDPSTERYWSM